MYKINIIFIHFFFTRSNAREKEIERGYDFERKGEVTHVTFFQTASYDKIFSALHLFNRATELRDSMKLPDLRSPELISSTWLFKFLSPVTCLLGHVSLRCCLVTNANLCIIRGPTIPGVTWRKLSPTPKQPVVDARTREWYFVFKVFGINRHLLIDSPHNGGGGG